MKQFIILTILYSLISIGQCKTGLSKGFNKSEAWTYGILCSIAVSLTALFASMINIFVVKNAPKKTKFWLETIIMFGCGALLGDAYVHITPEIYTAEDCDPRLISFFVFVGFFSFELLDKVMLFFGISHSHGTIDNGEEGRGHGHPHSHSHSHQHSHTLKEKKSLEPDLKKINQQDLNDRKSSQSNILNNENINVEMTQIQKENQIKVDQLGFDKDLIQGSPEKLNVVDQNPICNPHNENHNKHHQPVLNPEDEILKEEEIIKERNLSQENDLQKKEKKNLMNSIQSLQQANSSSDLLKKGEKKKFLASWRNKNGQAWLFLIADFIHQINDGLAIGITFLAKSKITALSTLIAIAAHELPLDLSVMSMLLESNFSICQALLCNQLKEISKLIGCLIGLGIGSTNEQALNYTLGFVIGNFLFIALVEMFGFLNKEKNKKLYISKCIAFILGIGSMYLILVIETLIEKVGEGEEKPVLATNNTTALLENNATFLRFLI